MSDAQDKSVDARMSDAVGAMDRDFNHIRTGRASTALVERILVDYYGTPTPLNQLTNLSVPEANLIVAQPYDPTQIAAIERAIQQADLGLNPSNDGKIIRIPVPPLTEERRREIVKRAHDMAESSRNGVRQARREGNDLLKRMERDKEISQDEEKRGHDEVQKLHDHYIGEVNRALETKETQIMEV